MSNSFAPAIIRTFKSPAVLNALKVGQRSFFPACSAMLRRNPSLTSRLFPHPHLSALPRYEISDTGDKTHLTVALPAGIKRENLDLTYDDNFLTIRGQTCAHLDSADHGSMTTKFQHSFLLGPALQTDKISANLDDGVLVVTVPKTLVETGQSPSKSIPVTIGSNEDLASISDNASTMHAEADVDFGAYEMAA